MNKYYKKWFFPLIFPALLLLAAVVLIPFVLGVLYSFTSWRGTYFANADSVWDAFVGLENYSKALQTEKFIKSFWYTVRYTLISVVVINVFGLLFAVMVTKIRKGAGLFRTILFLPNLLGGLALGFIWQIIFQVVFTDILFGPEGVLPVEFLSYMTQDNTKAIFALVLMTTWQYAGYMMIIFVAGINNVPTEIFESADIDGANEFVKFRKLTIPMIMPAITVVVFLTLATSFKLLDQNLALTDGKFDTRMLALQILRTTKDTNPPNYGLAQAQAVIFFIIVATITIIQVSITKKKEIEL
jgi:raffinose/stachyose/melibiose transport system permease protein